MPFSSPGVLASLNIVRLNALNLVNAEVVFEGIVAADVVVLLVFGSPDDASAAVEFAGEALSLTLRSTFL